MVTLKSIYCFFLILGIFFIPFNSYEGISFLGEYKRDGAIVFFLISIIVFSLDLFLKKKVKLPYNNILFSFLILFVSWIIVSTILNSPSVYENFMKQTSGFNRFIRQLFSLSIVLLILITTYNAFRSYHLKKLFFLIRRIFLYSFIFIACYGFIEILILHFNVQWLKNIILIFDYFPFTEVYLDFHYKRISSFSLEPPFLAIYLITIAGWMFSYLITAKGIKKFLPTIILFLLTFFSGSRTALIVVLFQFFLFMMCTIVASKKYQLIMQKLLFIISLFIIFLMIFNGKKLSSEIETKLNSLNFKENLHKNLSNRSRFGIQYTSVLIFYENPIIGVGFGQQGFHAKDKYPQWVTQNNYEFKEWYLNDNIKSFPPGFNLYTRLLAETGIIGMGIFCSFLALIIYQCKKLIKSRRNTERVLSIVLLISFVGFTINWLQFDSFRVYGFWICLGVLMLLTQKNYENE